MRRAVFFCLFGAAISLVSVQAVFGGASFFYKELNLMGGYSTRDKWVDRNDDMLSSVGFEYYGKFSNEYGDYMTADLQMSIAYDSTKNSRDGWGLQVQNAWLEYKYSQYTKLKVGHFDAAFGLEPLLDTHSTLLQTLAGQNIGFTRDWGVEYRGLYPYFDYEAALQLGSGQGTIRRQDGSYLFTTRIGTPATKNLQGGISFMNGRVLKPDGMRVWPKNELLAEGTTTKTRVGVDGQYLYGPYLFKAEAAYGKEDKNNVLGCLAEIDYTLPSNQKCEFELQFKSWLNDLKPSSTEFSTMALGVTYKLTQSSTIRAAYFHGFHLTDDSFREENKVIVQYYFLGI